MGNRLALIGDEMLEDFEFFWSEMDFFASNGYAPLLEIDRKILGMKGRESVSGWMSTERSSDARKQLFDAKGFGDIVVSTSIEGDHLVALCTANGEDNDRSVCKAADFAASLDTAHAGEIDVQQNQIRLELADQF